MDLDRIPIAIGYLGIADMIGNFEIAETFDVLKAHNIRTKGEIYDPVNAIPLRCKKDINA